MFWSLQLKIPESRICSVHWHTPRISKISSMHDFHALVLWQFAWFATAWPGTHHELNSEFNRSARRDAEGENSATIDAWACCWLITCKTSVQPNRMRKRDFTGSGLTCRSWWLRNFGIYHIGIACMGAGYKSDGWKGVRGWLWDANSCKRMAIWRVY